MLVTACVNFQKFAFVTKQIMLHWRLRELEVCVRQVSASSTAIILNFYTYVATQLYVFLVELYEFIPAAMDKVSCFGAD